MRKIALTIALCLLPVSAHAQGTGMLHFDIQCFTAAYVDNLLLKKYLEVVVGRGVGQRAWGIELYLSKDGETWTVIVVRGNMIKCLLSSGTYWEDVPHRFPLPGKPL